jgi:beta-ureidopropionase
VSEEDSMSKQVIRAALLQATWTGDRQSMIDKHVDYVTQAAAQVHR